MAKTKKNQSKEKSGNSQPASTPSPADDEFALLMSLMQPYVSSEDLRDALTRACTSTELFTMLFVNRRNEASVHLGLTWAVSEEMSALSSRTSFFLCDTDNTEFIAPIMAFLGNVLDFNTDFSSNCRDGILDTPSVIVFAPGSQNLVYGEYNCRITSLPTILMIINDYNRPSGGSTRDVITPAFFDAESTEGDYEDDYEDYEDESEYISNYEYTFPPDFQVFQRPRNPPNPQEVQQRVQERHDIQSEYQKALEADRKAEKEREEQKLREIKEAEERAIREEKEKVIAEEKDRLSQAILAGIPGLDAVTICLRTSTGKKVVFHVKRSESLLKVIEMAYATDHKAMDISSVRIRSMLPSVTYDSSMDPLPSVGNVTGDSSSFTFIAESH